MLLNYLKLLTEFGFSDVLDIGLATLFLALAIHVLRSARARAVSSGLIAFIAVFFFARHFKLQVTTWILQGIAAVIVLLLIIVFQSEIRRFLERFPAKLILKRKSLSQNSQEIAEVLTEALVHLSVEGRGALVVIPGQDPLDAYLSGGTILKGLLSKSIILSIFDPNSPGHDGAVLIHGPFVESFGLRLPLSEQHHKLHDRGTRHAAALGLTEHSDALVVAVSEETSRISYAAQGELHTLESPGMIAGHILDFLKIHNDEEGEPARRPGWFAWYFKDLMLALLCAILLWLFIVPAAVVEKRTYRVPVVVQNIPDTFSLSQVTPREVEITLTGARRNLFQIKSQDLMIRLDGTLTRFGRKTYPISKSLLLLPPDVEILQISPEEVELLVEPIN